LAPKIYHMHPLAAGRLREWPRLFTHARALGFDHLGTAPLFAPGAAGDVFLSADPEVLHPALEAPDGADEAVRMLCEAAGNHGLRVVLDLVLDRMAADSPLRAREPGWFVHDGGTEEPPDPRRPPRRRQEAAARFDDPAVRAAWADFWAERLRRLAEAGVGGFRCLYPDQVPPCVWRTVIAAVREAVPEALFIAWTHGVPRGALPALAGAGFDRTSSSLPWWDARASWFAEEVAALHEVAPALATPEPSFADRLAAHLDPRADLGIAYRRMLKLAAALGSGMLVPMGFEYATRRSFDPQRATPADFDQVRQEASVDLTAEVRAANALADQIATKWADGELRALTGPAAAVTVLLRANAADARQATLGLLAMINPDLTRSARPETPALPLPASAAVPLGNPQALSGALALGRPLDPGEVRLARLERLADIVTPWSQNTNTARDATRQPRVVIEAISPAVDGGAFPAKRVVGAPVIVEADIFADGHDVLGAELLWRCADEAGWRRVPMVAIGNDRWAATFVPTRIGRHLYAIEGWWDAWGTFRRDLTAKRDAGQELHLEAEEGSRLLAAIAAGAPGDAAPAISRAAAALGSLDTEARVAMLLDEATDRAARRGLYRPFLVRSAELPVEADRPQATFASWYEMFPRSATRDARRHGTFRDVIAELPRIRAMGFDVLYFPPIHPIGRTNRKGRNNSLDSTPQDVGSPYAIGAEEGGHDALHPALGTFEDFRALIAAAHEHGMEIALDFAIQCSLDHPWIKQHPGWFDWRPDGSIRYAENPPKKYQDIVNVDFYAPDAIPDLWLALRNVVWFWVEQGIRIFRVDNPHTKPFPFWQWMIADIRARDPTVIFLAEAFTRPKVMYRLAKLGFTQSYTYFTWRYTKREMIDYLTELNAPPVRDLFRPNFFVNTPDINPWSLEGTGRAGFLIRAALAATLSGLWGMYSGFELCEAARLPGREEYLDSEKYEIRVRDWNAPGNIVQEIAALNRIRRANPALQSHLGVRFYNAANDEVLLFGKTSALDGRAMTLVAVSFDPRRVQEAAIEVPLWEWGLPDDATVQAEDLMRGHRFAWHGKRQVIRLDPADLPFAIWRIAP